jgi:hypothetical protein
MVSFASARKFYLQGKSLMLSQKLMVLSSSEIKAKTISNRSFKKNSSIARSN